ncbi:MAG: hypothetical protein K8L97_10625 [Anaerolineae bacterium]|nr:hypothetical protein [Anaerolineae bacterium]
MSATQALGQESKIITRREIAISVEVVAYIALIALAVILRIAQIDSVPMTGNEARQALAAWRTVYAEAPGSPITPESPLLFALHSLSFTVLGASEFSARIWTVLAGIGLLLSPLLFRDLLGRARTFMFCLMLVFSPVMLVATRTDSPVVWTMLVVLIGLWALWRYHRMGQERYAVGTILCLAVTLFLTDPTGPFYVLVLVLAASFAFWLRMRDVQTDANSEPPRFIRLNDWPWGRALPIAGLVVFLVGTQFMLYPAGLSIIGELLNTAVRGLTTPRPQIPAIFPLQITLFYEPFTIFLGVASVWWLIQKDRFSTVDRFLAGLAIFGTALSIIYAGVGAEHSLWLVMPLVGLGSAAAAELLTKPSDLLWWRAPEWSRWLLALAMIALLGMFAIHGQALGRSLLFLSDSPLDFTQLSGSINVVWVIIIILFTVIGYFLAAGVWGIGMTTRGGLLGMMVFLLVTSLSGGWRAAVFSAADPVELWNRQAINGDTTLLRQTLWEFSARETGGFPKIPIVALTPDDGVVAWLLRDFPNARFIPDAAGGKLEEIVLLPAVLELPDLGGSYVGQRFTISSTWDLRSLRFIDLPAWWLQRRTRTGGVPADEMVLWVRQDVYDGVQQEQ